VDQGGAVLAVLGGVSHAIAAKERRNHNASVNACRDSTCQPGIASNLTSSRSKARTMQRIAIGSYAVGGAGLATGAVLMYLNRPKPFIVPYPADEVSAGQPGTLGIAPMIEGDARGVVATLRF
jgi:hypothetical protein